MHKILLLSCLLPIMGAAQINSTQVLSRIGFGSCISQNDSQKIWYKVIEKQPELFVLLGDNIYGDTKDMELLRQKYEMFASKPGYIELQKKTPVIATWDDHDYGKNDAGKEYPMKEESKKIFLDFFKEPQESDRRKHAGIYTSYEYGVDGKKLQIIMLDCRTFRDKLMRVRLDLKCKGPYFKMPSKSKTFLGEAQWKWLEEELKKPADLRLICSSTQFLVDFNGWEAWVNMPHERERMMQLIEKTKASGVFFISGDLHYSELSKVKRDNCYALYDLTSSGMTHGHSCDGGNINRIGQPFMEANYGFINIDWNARSLKLEIIDKANVSQIVHEIPFAEIKF
ncbi:MAG: alkaline phosphatase family protein [Bacteroidetes bacterium]|nr:alkaline phosphatase family protein [Bacteroidota bacterium]